MRPELKLVVVAVFAGACGLAALADEHVGKNLERGEPARWSQPDDTARKREETANKEAKAALAEALRECRSDRERTHCEREARNQYRLDIAAARATK
jgi:hypothetical protein